jgi:NTE family protein
MGSHEKPHDLSSKAHDSNLGESDSSLWDKLLEYFPALDDDEAPGMFDALSMSVNIMQDRITRSRMVGEPPEVVLAPVLNDFLMVEFHRGKEAIEKGRDQVRRQADVIKAWLE